jgi:hypothetical protein
MRGKCLSLPTPAKQAQGAEAGGEEWERGGERRRGSIHDGAGYATGTA